MATILVTAAQLASTAEELSDLNNQFKSAVNSLVETEETLSGMWEGEAKEAFRNAFYSDKTQMDNFYNAIAVYVMRLLEAALRYAQAEAANVETGTTRTYH